MRCAEVSEDGGRGARQQHWQHQHLVDKARQKRRFGIQLDFKPASKVALVESRLLDIPNELGNRCVEEVKRIALSKTDARGSGKGKRRAKNSAASHARSIIIGAV